jgi:hypothetical protein
MDQNRDEERRFTEQVGLADVLDVFDTVSGPVVTSGDVATVTGCSRDSARRKLNRLHDQGRLGRRKTAGRVVYWRRENAAPNRVNTDDTIFTDRSSFSSGHEALSEEVDELLYQPSS